MWTPWNVLTSWGRTSNGTAVENARLAAVACSRARLERAEIEQYVDGLVAQRERRAVSA